MSSWRPWAYGPWTPRPYESRSNRARALHDLPLLVRHGNNFVHKSPSLFRSSAVDPCSSSGVFLGISCWVRLFLQLGTSPFLRTQTRPAIEFVSGEEGLRPKFYFFEYSFLEYALTDTLKYAKAPGPHCGAEGRWRRCRIAGLAFYERAVHQIAFLLSARGGGLRA